MQLWELMVHTFGPEGMVAIGLMTAVAAILCTAVIMTIVTIIKLIIK